MPIFFISASSTGNHRAMSTDSNEPSLPRYAIASSAFIIALGSAMFAFCCSAWIICAVSTLDAPWPTENFATAGPKFSARSTSIPAATIWLTASANSLRPIPFDSASRRMRSDIVRSCSVRAMPALMAMSRMIA